jgi:CBS domain-containing protein
MKTAAEVMDRNFFYASPSDSIAVLLHEMDERALASVPILDHHGRPLGVATTAEIGSCYDVEELIEHLRRPAVCVDENTPVDIAARTLAMRPSSNLILVNGAGVAVGALSAMALLRALLGLAGAPGPIRRQERDVGWDAAPLLELEAVHRATDAPGIVLLSPGLDARARRIVWAEAATNMHERLAQMLCMRQNDGRLEAILEAYPRAVRFRCLTVYDEGRRERLAHALCNVEHKGSDATPASLEPEASPRGSDVMPKGEPIAALG